MAKFAGFRNLGGPWPWTRVWMTLKLISSGRSHQDLSKSYITLWVWLWRPFSPTLKSRDRYRKSGRRKIPYLSLVSLVNSHWWSISWTEIDREFRNLASSWPWPWPWMTVKLILLRMSHRVLSKSHKKITVLSTPSSFIVTKFVSNFEVMWYVTRDWYRKSGPRKL